MDKRQQNTRQFSVVKRLLKGKNIPQKSWARILSEIIGGTTKTAARRLADESILSLGELFALTDHFDTTATALLQAELPEERKIPGARKATLHMGSGKWPCKVVVRKGLPGPADCFVAYEDVSDGHLIVCRADEIPKSGMLQGVLSLHIDVFGTSGPVVAILDDEETATLPLCRFLQIDAGFATRYFQEPESIELLLQVKPHPDAYILDWTLSGGRTSRKLIESIRRIDGKCPILLLTGTIQSRKENESEIADLVRTHQIDVCVKPFPASIIAEKLKSLLAQQILFPNLEAEHRY